MGLNRPETVSYLSSVQICNSSCGRELWGEKREWAQIQIQLRKEMQKFIVLQINLWNEGKGEKT